jgi:hypothetical protein
MNSLRLLENLATWLCYSTRIYWSYAPKFKAHDGSIKQRKKSMRIPETRTFRNVAVARKAKRFGNHDPFRVVRLLDGKKYRDRVIVFNLDALGVNINKGQVTSTT